MLRDNKGRFLKNHERPQEWVEKNRKFLLGENNPFFGKKHTEETKQIIREKRALQDMSWRKDNFRHTEATKNKISENRIGKAAGENNHSWKGGITPINALIRASSKMKKWRKAVFERDNYTCQACGKRGGDLQADHELPFALFPDLRFEILNGRTLCVPCHKKTLTFMGNQYKTICT